MTDPAKTAKGIDRGNLRYGLLSALSMARNESNSDRNERLAQFSIVFVKDAVHRDDVMLRILSEAG